MKKYRRTLRFFLTSSFIYVLFCASFLGATPKKFPKISFLEPYVYLKNTPESTQALTYYGQMESCGVNIIVGLLNPRTSPLATAFQYYNNQPISTANGVSLFGIGGGDAAAILRRKKLVQLISIPLDILSTQPRARKFKMDKLLREKRGVEEWAFILPVI